jgi:hypothetical protein
MDENLNVGDGLLDILESDPETHNYGSIGIISDNQ